MTAKQYSMYKLQQNQNQTPKKRAATVNLDRIPLGEKNLNSPVYFQTRTDEKQVHNDHELAIQLQDSINETVPPFQVKFDGVMTF